MANTLNTVTVDGVTYSAEDYAKQQTAAASSAVNANSALGKDAFLQLLVTQMQYQDPLDPQDNSEYLSQLAQFSALEQMSNVATALEKTNTLVSNIDTSMLVGQLSGMIGKDLQWTSTVAVTNSDGTAVTDSNGKAKTTTTTYEGTVTGVSISDGSPSIIAKGTDGQTYKVAISDITRVGTGS
ncbi:flagellar hook capping FlgD N-terminal domain-containing protein [uncultured Selenomonas sp.]|uniref:flagellar hook capping FlgD N-terminal domain-containing protein n=1 Tax=uncultured Selenomonas sp. TaxID=159275 RepID=UPI0025E3670F|nr:flagellar hook capping FlgD N-terminal domain-containing protein [uncultured Selenomonas sp.]